MSIPIDVLTAEMMLHRVNRANDRIYIVRRPSVSLKELHHRGKIPMLNMYRATDKFVMVVVVCSFTAISGRAAGTVS